MTKTCGSCRWWVKYEHYNDGTCGADDPQTSTGTDYLTDCIHTPSRYQKEIEDAEE